MIVDLEEACEVMHNAYEDAALKVGWETQERSRKPWADVPEENKATMRIAVKALLDHITNLTLVNTHSYPCKIRLNTGGDHTYCQCSCHDR